MIMKLKKTILTVNVDENKTFKCLVSFVLHLILKFVYFAVLQTFCYKHYIMYASNYKFNITHGYNMYKIIQLISNFHFLLQVVRFIELFVFGNYYSTPATRKLKFRPKKLAYLKCPFLRENSPIFHPNFTLLTFAAELLICALLYQ